VLDRDAREVGQTGSVMWKVKSDGTGGTMAWPKDSAMARPPEDLLPTGGDDDAVEALGRARAEGQPERFLVLVDGADGRRDADGHAGTGGRGLEAVDDGGGVIGRGKHPSVLFGLRGDSA
jgi:hypothetical protein